jgi:hypothetical protein
VEAVNQFDVEAFADIVAKTGAAWVVFTTTHGKFFFTARRIRWTRCCRVAPATAILSVKLPMRWKDGISD